MPAVIRFIALTCLATGLAACGGGGGTTPQSAPDPIAAAECDPANPATHAECGTVLLGLTDADGDFLNYTVDVVSLSLETANGRVVEPLPRSTRIDFTEYVDLTELLTAATVPPATAMPSARPRRRTNQLPTSAIDGRGPNRAAPTDTSTTNATAS